MKTEDQSADVLNKALGRVKFVELCHQIRVKKALDEKKIKEHVGSDFPSLGMSGMHGAQCMKVATNWYVLKCLLMGHIEGACKETPKQANGAQLDGYYSNCLAGRHKASVVFISRELVVHVVQN